MVATEDNRGVLGLIVLKYISDGFEPQGSLLQDAPTQGADSKDPE